MPINATSGPSVSSPGVRISDEPAAPLSTLADRITVGPPAPVYRAPPAQGFTAWVRNLFQKITSVLPGAPRAQSPFVLTPQLPEYPQHVNPELSGETLAEDSTDDEIDGPTQSEAAQSEERARADLISRTGARIESEVEKVLANAAKSAGSRSPDELANDIHGAFSKAESILTEVSGPDETGGAKTEKAAALFVAAGLNRLEPRELENVLRAMSAEDLHKICTLRAATASSAPRITAAITAARSEMALRHTRLLTDFDKSSQALLKLPATSDLSSPTQLGSVLSELDSAGQSLHKLQTLCEACGQKLPPEALKLRDQVADHFHKMLESSEPNLAALSNAEVVKFRAALAQFGVELDPAVLQKTAAKRLAPLEAACKQSAAAVFRGVLNGSPERVLRGLKDLEDGFEMLRETQSALGDPTSGVQDGFKLRQKILSSALDQLSPAEKSELSKKLHAADTEALREGIYTASDAASTSGLDELSDSFNTLGAYLEECTSVADEAAGVKPAATSGTPAELSPAAREAFSNVLGIRWTANGTPVFGV
ncbi:hypothetical protein [Peristeroidobacter soli]|uniref:hypothetical protein n=1 Tax=Peristeroidobacter soli TaxID=2497877 RepID=UPI00101CB1D7|nr:hypothetical protein [Peristeroidobacter soli]